MLLVSRTLKWADTDSPAAEKEPRKPRNPWNGNPGQCLTQTPRSDIGGGHVMHRNDGRAVRVFRLSDIAARERLPGPAAYR
jgi:hypothetical protein